MKLQKHNLVEGELVVGWLSIFDVRARLTKRKEKKVFLIGLPKTATTSAHYALHNAGYKSEHFPYRMVNYFEGELVFNKRDLHNHDAVSDLPVAASVETLHDLFPESYFVYTTRNKDKWLDSCRRHPWPMECILHADLLRTVRKYAGSSRIFDSLLNNLEKLRLMHERVLGSSIFIPEAFSEAYDRYERKIKTLFAGNDNFIELNITDGKDGKEKLGALLNIEMSGSFERKDCFYTWFFKKLADIAGWDKILSMREQYRDVYLKNSRPEPLETVQVRR